MHFADRARLPVIWTDAVSLRVACPCPSVGWWRCFLPFGTILQRRIFPPGDPLTAQLVADPAVAGAGAGHQTTPPPPAGRPARRSLSARVSWPLVGVWLGVIAPFLLFCKYAMVSAPDFDGAMNLQVAQNFARGLGYVRMYDGTRVFPAEIETSGPYVFLSAGFIKLFGASTFVFELTNLLFVGLLLVTVSLLLRRWPVLRIVGPTLALFAVPGMANNAMLGYGEYVVAALVTAGLGLVGIVARGSRRPLWVLFAAGALIGLGFTVKIVGAMAIPVFIVGLVLVLLVRPALSWWRVGLAGAAGGALPIVLVEAERLVELGWHPYLAYWHEQIKDIAAQAGVTGSGPGYGVNSGAVSTPTVHQPLLTTVANHVHLLSQAIGLNAEFMLLVLALPFILLVVLFLMRGCSWREWLAKPGVVVTVLLAVYAGGYLVWWMAITPDAKAWLRRIIIGLVAIACMYLLLAGMVKDRLREPTPLISSVSRWRRISVQTGVAVLAVLYFLCALPGLANLNSQVAAMWKTEPTEANDQLIGQLASQSKALLAQGDVLYGSGWWSAPNVALYADVPLANLLSVKACDAATGIPTGKAFLIWDYYAVHLVSPTPQSTVYTFSQVDKNRYGSIWKIAPRPGVCPSG